MGGRIRRCIGCMPFFFLVVVLHGCGNLDAVGKFADGTQALSAASGKFYEMELQTDRQLAAMTVDLGAPEDSPECKNPDGSHLTPWDCATKGKNLMAEARRNRAAISSLAEYARGLQEISTFNDDENIEMASKELSGNLGSIATTFGKRADKNDEFLASAISSLAKVYLDLKIRKVIYEKVKLAHPHVIKITDTLRKDIKRQHQRLALDRVNAKATREEWFRGFRAGYQAPGVSESKRVFLSLSASQLVDDELKDELSAQPSALFLEKLEATVESCIRAHQAIQTPNLSEESGTIIKFISDARNLISTLNQMPN